ncbi:hypothetical protein GGF31_004132 [Allomyces arbusculus]|nr:hypothetical protein GGF31_004132 [Allomyces arbusculus]
MGNTPSTPSAVEPAPGTFDQAFATAAAANAARQDAYAADRTDATATASAAASSSPARARHAHQLATLEQSQDAHLGARRPVPLVLSGKPAPTAPIALPSPRHAAHHHQYGTGFMDRDHGHAHGAGAESTSEPSPTVPHGAGAAAARNPALSAAVAAAAAQFGSSPFVGSPLSYASSVIGPAAGTAASAAPSAIRGPLPNGDVAHLVADMTQLDLHGQPPHQQPPPSWLAPPELPSVEADLVTHNTASDTSSSTGRTPTAMAPESALTAALRQQALAPSDPLAARPTNGTTHHATSAGFPAPIRIPSTIQFIADALTDGTSGSGDFVAPSAVYITGSFNNWQTKVPLRRVTGGNAAANPRQAVFSVTLPLAPGVYRLKFIVDDEWRCCRNLPTAQDDDGTLVNYIEVAAPPVPVITQPMGPRARASTAPDVPLATTLPAPILAPVRHSPTAESMAHSVPASRTDPWANGAAPLSESPPGSYTTIVPTPRMLSRLASAGAAAAAAAASGTSVPVPVLEDLVDDDGTDVDENAPMLDPPTLPVHLTKVVLNQARPEEEAVPVPPHVVLNHLYACSIRDGVMAVAITSRYRKKHVTTVYYRPVSI